MKAMENWQPDRLPTLLNWRKGQWFGNLLVNSLMRPAVIVEGDISPDDEPSMPFAEDQDVVQAFAANRAEETLTQRICFWGLERCVQQFRMNAGDGTSNSTPYLCHRYRKSRNGDWRRRLSPRGSAELPMHHWGRA